MVVTFRILVLCKLLFTTNILGDEGNGAISRTQGSNETVLVADENWISLHDGSFSKKFVSSTLQNSPHASKAKLRNSLHFYPFKRGAHVYRDPEIGVEDLKMEVLGHYVAINWTFTGYRFGEIPRSCLIRAYHEGKEVASLEADNVNYVFNLTVVPKPFSEVTAVLTPKSGDYTGPNSASITARAHDLAKAQLILDDLPRPRWAALKWDATNKDPLEIFRTKAEVRCLLTPPHGRTVSHNITETNKLTGEDKFIISNERQICRFSFFLVHRHFGSRQKPEIVSGKLEIPELEKLGVLVDKIEAVGKTVAIKWTYTGYRQHETPSCFLMILTSDDDAEMTVLDNHVLVHLDNEITSDDKVDVIFFPSCGQHYERRIENYTYSHDVPKLSATFQENRPRHFVLEWTATKKDKFVLYENRLEMEAVGAESNSNWTEIVWKGPSQEGSLKFRISEEAMTYQFALRVYYDTEVCGESKTDAISVPSGTPVLIKELQGENIGRTVVVIWRCEGLEAWENATYKIEVTTDSQEKVDVETAQQHALITFSKEAHYANVTIAANIANSVVGDYIGTPSKIFLKKVVDQDDALKVQIAVNKTRPRRLVISYGGNDAGSLKLFRYKMFMTVNETRQSWTQHTFNDTELNGRLVLPVGDDEVTYSVQYNNQLCFKEKCSAKDFSIVVTVPAISPVVIRNLRGEFFGNTVVAVWKCTGLVDNETATFYIEAVNDFQNKTEFETSNMSMVITNFDTESFVNFSVTPYVAEYMGESSSILITTESVKNIMLDIRMFINNTRPRHIVINYGGNYSHELSLFRSVISLNVKKAGGSEENELLRSTVLSGSIKRPIGNDGGTYLAIMKICFRSHCAAEKNSEELQANSIEDVKVYDLVYNISGSRVALSWQTNGLQEHEHPSYKVRIELIEGKIWPVNSSRPLEQTSSFILFGVQQHGEELVEVKRPSTILARVTPVINADYAGTSEELRIIVPEEALNVSPKRLTVVVYSSVEVFVYFDLIPTELIPGEDKGCEVYVCETKSLSSYCFSKSVPPRENEAFFTVLLQNRKYFATAVCSTNAGSGPKSPWHEFQTKRFAPAPLRDSKSHAQQGEFIPKAVDAEVKVSVQDGLKSHVSWSITTLNGSRFDEAFIKEFELLQYKKDNEVDYGKGGTITRDIHVREMELGVSPGYKFERSCYFYAADIKFKNGRRLFKPSEEICYGLTSPAFLMLYAFITLIFILVVAFAAFKYKSFIMAHFQPKVKQPTAQKTKTVSHSSKVESLSGKASSSTSKTESARPPQTDSSDRKSEGPRK